jgi:hypothetical protein
MMRPLALWHCLKIFLWSSDGKGQQRDDVQQQTAIIAGVAANRAFQPFTLLSSLAPRAGLVTWCQTFVHCSQQTAASNQSNELTPLHVEHRDFFPYAY